MNKRTTTGLIILSVIFPLRAQIYTPSGTIQGTSGNNNVGIGTNIPSAKLETNNTAAGITSFKSVGVNGYLLIDNVGSGENYYNASSFHEFQIGGTPKMRIISNGNVGIGTSTPSALLDVYTNLPTPAIYNSQNWTTNNSGYSLKLQTVWNSNGINQQFVQKYDGIDYTSLSFFAGKVGIGTTTPDTKLTVNGKIHAEEVKIDLAVPAPDYVFASDYKLKTLKEVENYINKNNHLPEIPSAQEMDKNGLMLAEMNMNLLKKVEELTLYMIELEKRNNILSKEIDTLKKENEPFKTLSERFSKIENQLNKQN